MVINLFLVSHSRFSWFFIGSNEFVKEYIKLISTIETVNFRVIIENLDDSIINHLFDFLQNKIITENSDVKEKMNNLVSLISDFHSIEEDLDLGIELYTSTSDILLVYNDKFYKAFVYRKNELTEKTIQMSFDCTIIKTYPSENFEQLEQFFKKKSFYESIEVLYEKVTLFENLYDIGHENDQAVVEKYINNNYEITKNVKDKIKANVINDDLTRLLENSKKSIISKLMENLGVQKKRYGDGIYYIGIRKNILDIETLNLKRQQETEELKLTFN